MSHKSPKTSIKTRNSSFWPQRYYIILDLKAKY